MSDDSRMNRVSRDDDAGDSLELPRRTDFAVLDPTRDAARFESTVKQIAAAAMAARARVSDGSWSALSPVVAWSRLTLAAAAVVFLVAGAALVSVPVPAVAAAPSSLAESAGIPKPLVDIATETRSLTAAELVDAFDTMAVSAGKRR